MCAEQEAQAALQSVKAEKQALEECLSATASAQRHTPPSAQPAPVTPQPHRSSNPSSAKLSEGAASPCQQYSAAESHENRHEAQKILGEPAMLRLPVGHSAVFQDAPSVRDRVMVISGNLHKMLTQHREIR